MFGKFIRINVFALALITAFACLQAPQAEAQSRGGGGRGGGGGHMPGPGPGGGGHGGPGRPNPGPGHGGPSRSYISPEKAFQIASAYYRAILFRQGEAAGLDFWIRAISNSPSTDGMISAAGEFAKSAEFYRNIYNRYSDEQILTNIHQVFFGRNMTIREARTYGRMFDQGRTEEALELIVSSPEFARNFL